MKKSCRLAAPGSCPRAAFPPSWEASAISFQLRSRTLLVWLLLVLPCIWLAPPAFAVRAVPWAPGRTVIVKLKLGSTTEIVFPGEVDNFSNPDPRSFSFQMTGDRILVKAQAPFQSARFFVIDTSNRSFIVQLQEVGPDETEDDSVEISPETFEKRAEPPPPGPDRAVLTLIKAMHLDKPLPGYKVSDEKGRIFFHEPEVMQMRRLKIYEGQQYVGYVIEIENLSDGPIRADPQQYKFNGLVAGVVLDMYLSPAEPKDSVEAVRGHPKKTRGYAVVLASELRKKAGGAGK